MRKLTLSLTVLSVGLFAIAAPGTSFALEDVKAHVGFGASMPIGDLSDVLDTGWHLNGGATLYPSTKPVGIRLDLAWDWWDMSGDALNQIDTDGISANGIQPPDDGDAQSITTTFGVLWDPETSGNIGYYLMAGVSAHYLYADLGEDGYYYGYVCDPWYWWYCYPSVVEGEYEIKDESKWEWGLNAGVGMTFELASGSQFYVEATYQWIDTENSATWIPINIGWRW